MFKDKYVFAQLVSFLNRSKFNRIVTKYNGNKYVKHFTCWNQLLALMFGQLSNRVSLSSNSGIKFFLIYFLRAFQKGQSNSIQQKHNLQFAV